MEHAARLVALILTLLTPGCVLGSGCPKARPRPVEVPSGHLHSVECGHFVEDGIWHHQHGHVHGPGCGHVLRNGKWVSP